MGGWHTPFDIFFYNYTKGFCMKSCFGMIFFQVFNLGGGLAPFGHSLMISLMHEKFGLCHQRCCFTSAWLRLFLLLFFGVYKGVGTPHLFIF